MASSAPSRSLRPSSTPWQGSARRRSRRSSEIPTAVLTALSTTTQAAVQAALAAFGSVGKLIVPGSGGAVISSTSTGVSVTQGTAGFQLGTDGSLTLLGQNPRFIAGSTTVGIVPIGGIVLWSSSAGSIPPGWAVCNGANGTPNLTGCVVQGVPNGGAVNAATSIIGNTNTSSSTVTFSVLELYYIMRIS